MDKKKLLKDITQVTLSNGFRLISSILIGLVLPIIFSLENYGYYRLFALYLTYIGLFHFGFVDGIFLHFGGKKYEELDKPKFILYTRFLLFFQMVISIIIIMLSILIFDGDRQFIFICLALNIISTNMINYYQYILQVTSKFKEFSFLNTLYAILISILVGAIFLLNIDNYRVFIIFILAINYFLLFWYFHAYRSISFGSKAPIKSVKNDLIYFFKLGIPLLIANFITILIVNIPKLIVDWFFSIEVFAIFAFSYSMMSLANIFVGATSTVIYPTLKKIDESKLKDLYNHSISFVLIFVMVAMILYFPLYLFVDIVVPKYSESLNILRIVFPGLVISSAVQIVKINYFRVLKHIKQYLITGLISLVSTALIVYLSYVIFGTIESIAISSVFSLFTWYLLTELYFVKVYKIKPIKNLIYIILGNFVFYFSSSIPNVFYGSMLFMLLILAITFVMHKKLLIKMIKNKKID